jgi:hypothetical protein
VLADGQRVRLAWKPQHTFVIGPAAEPITPGDLSEEVEVDSDG